jgi:glycosyltransferase involved in cell wall biosynthesis
MSRRRTVLYTDHFPEVAGGQMALLTRLEHLDRERWRPVVAVPETNGRLHEELRARDVEIVEIQFNRGDIRTKNEKGILSNPFQLSKHVPVVLGAVADLIRIIENERVELIHTNSFKSAVLSVLPATLTGVPLVYHAHSSRAYSDHGVLDHVVCTASDRIIANSSFTAETFDPWEGKIDVVYNPVDADRFDPDRVSTEPVRDRYEATDGPLIGSVGRLTPRKRQTDLIEAFPKVLDSYPDAKLLLVGGQYEGLGTEFEMKVTDRIRELGLEDAVIVTGFLEDIESVIAALDVLVHPAEKEPLGRVVIEALLLETPVVASGDGGIAEIIDHGETGLLVPQGNPAAIADGVTRLLDDPEWATSLARAGRRTARHRFAPERITDAEERIYEDVISA